MLEKDKFVMEAGRCVMEPGRCVMESSRCVMKPSMCVMEARSVVLAGRLCSGNRCVAESSRCVAGYVVEEGKCLVEGGVCGGRRQQVCVCVYACACACRRQGVEVSCARLLCANKFPLMGHLSNLLRQEVG